ncbi:MAG: hypothetical protein AAFO29_12605 [Actinomycetota bacterium]
MHTTEGKADACPCGYLDEPKPLYRRPICLSAVSKNLSGDLHRLAGKRQDCDEPDCVTLKTVHALRVDVSSYDCDSEVGKRLDGRFVVPNLVHALDTEGHGRGLHTGSFLWDGTGIEVEGEISGVTNLGTHRRPVFDDCQQCDERGVMEGRLCGRIVEADREELIGCRVVAAYRIRFDPSESFQDTGVTGVIEGMVVCPCGWEEGW